MQEQSERGREARDEQSKSLSLLINDLLQFVATAQEEAPLQTVQPYVEKLKIILKKHIPTAT